MDIHNTGVSTLEASRPPPLVEEDEAPEHWLNAFVRNVKLDDLPTPAKVDQAMEEYARHPDRNFPKLIRYSWAGRELATVQRILHYAVDRVLIVRDLDMTYLRGFDGLWFPLDSARSSKAVAATHELVEYTANAAAEDARNLIEQDPTGYEVALMAEHYPEWLKNRILETATHNLCREVSGRLSGLSSIGSVRNEKGLNGVFQINSGELSDYDRHQVIPLEDGGAISLHNNDVLTPDEITYLHLENMGWRLPPPDFNLLNQPLPAEGAMILARYGEILKRFAYHLLQTSKCVDIIRVPQSNWGKSTLAELLEGALPGMIARTSLRVLSERSRFTPSAKLMATKRLVFFDEAGSDKAEISMTRWMELADRQHIEEKGKNAYDANRTATAILLGQTWPALDSSVPRRRTACPLGIHGQHASPDDRTGKATDSVKRRS